MAYTQYNKINDTKQQVDQVVSIMKNNIEKVLQRDDKLSDLENRSEDLREGSRKFEKISTKLKNKLWCKNIKFIMAIIVVFLILIMIIVLIIIKK